MIIITRAEQAASTIEHSLGTAEYSYYFVLEAFRPLLERIGTVVTVGEARPMTWNPIGVWYQLEERREPANPRVEVGAIKQICRTAGEPCVFLDFSPPHRMAFDVACPAAPVFAWEYDDIPNETWAGDPQQNWAAVLEFVGAALVHSNHALEAVNGVLHAPVSVAAIPAPIYDRFASVPNTADRTDPLVFSVDARIHDSRRRPQVAATSALAATATFTISRSATTRHSRVRDPVRLSIDGVLYTAVLNPADGRKNWRMIVQAFIAALRDQERATLLLKFVHREPETGLEALAALCASEQPFRCRVVAMNAFLSDKDYRRLAGRSQFAVNASSGEGQCLPLMEYMSCGTPAIAPDHSALADYIGGENAFVVASEPKATGWPHDPRSILRTRHHPPVPASLVRAFEDSYRCFVEEPERYRAMCQNARETMQAHCSDAVIEPRLRAFIEALGARP
ncbi:MAG: glycosyltransferase [Pseudomonadota bacterium]